MRIGYYIHHTSLKSGGIFTYSIGVLKLLIGSDDIEKIVLIINKAQEDYFNIFKDISKLEIVIINRKNFFTKIRLAISYFLIDTHTLYNDNKTINSKLDILKKLSFKINPYKKILHSSKIDLLHVPLQYSPIYGSKVPIIITMHDLQEFHFPEFFHEAERLHRSLNNKKAISNADHVIVSFGHVRNDLRKYFNINDDRISVCPPPFAEDWFASTKETSKEELTIKYNLNNKFILYPAATWRHKNHINLIKAIDVLKNEGLTVHLVCTGNKTDYYKTIINEIKKLRVEKQVRFLGIVPESDLIGLYKCASLVVIPTLYEAGSGPLYEAMKYSVPVICSNVTSLPDTMGSDEYLFDPTNINETAMKIKKMLTDEKFRKNNLLNSKVRMEYLSSINYTQNFINAYKKVC